MIYKEISLGETMKNTQKMRNICLKLVLLALFYIASEAYAITGDNNLDGIISYEEKGELVAMIQTRLRELDYFYFKPTGSFRAMTREAVIAFQKNQELDSGAVVIADGTVGEQSLRLLFSASAVRAPIPQSINIPIGKRHTPTQTQTGELRSWQSIKEELILGKTYSMMDYNTGTKFSLVFTGGAEHAEMESPSSEDTAILKKVFGDDFSFFKRPMLIEIGGSFIACSLQGHPHGEDTIQNNDMKGHVCLFFYESRSHVGLLPDEEHTANIRLAAGAN